ncbi:MULTISPECIES: hypothetical protein [Arthrobacter]|uniref:Uncharacterized protein n=1 Tax=Arthrobacter flavus TaxID=95172 RepID=A0ABW4Q6W0_9MICC|nr:hypothetical protein [Arthrobacter sp. CAN_C5]MBP2216036.1 hypothetical protein [Arthrobacter sp. CAN_C5]
MPCHLGNPAAGFPLLAVILITAGLTIFSVIANAVEGAEMAERQRVIDACHSAL